MCYKLLVLGINLEKVTNNNNDESAAERVLEKYINKSENSTDSALFSDIFCSRGACFIFYGYTTAIFSWYQSTTHIKTTDWCLKKHARVRLHVQLELISSNSQQDVVRLSGRICDLCGLIRLPRVVDASTRKSNTGGGGEVVQLHISMITHRRSISAISGCHVDTHSSDIIKFILQKLQAKCDSSQNVTVNSLNSEAGGCLVTSKTQTRISRDWIPTRNLQLLLIPTTYRLFIT